MKNTALITGASSGIGKELARIHSEKGGDLVLVARSEGRLNELRSELEDKYSVQVRIISKDLADMDAPRQLYEEVKADGIELEYLINNAGFGGHGKFHERDWEDDLAMIQLNVVALSALTRFFLGDMVARDSGRVLNVSSTACLPPGGPLQSVYFATKHFVTAFSYGVAEELDGSQVTVTALLPGATETEFASASGMENADLFKKMANARTVAEEGYNGMLAGRLNVVSGLSVGEKLKMAAIPFASKKMLLKQIRQLQEVPE